MMLNVPLTMMCGVVGERASRRNQVVSEVSGNWGGANRRLVARCCRSRTAIRGPTRQDASRAQHPPFIFFPRPWKLTARRSRERKRSLFTVVVYTAKFKLRGRFAPPPDGRRQAGP